MSSTRAHLFFREHLEPNLRAWQQSELEPQLAMNLAVSLNQMADHFWHAFKDSPDAVLNSKSVPSFRRALSDRNASFALIRDVADAHKHFKLDREDRKLTDSSQATVGSLGWGEAQYGRGRWGSPPEIVVTFDDGSKHHFSGAVADVYAMWKSMLEPAA